MELWKACILGLVEGLTEFLPVSSTGHLLITQRLLGIDGGAAANAYAIVIQAGAIAAVLVLYRTRVASMLRGFLGRDPAGARLARALIVAFLPAAVAGLTLGDRIEHYLFGAWPVVAAWAVGGVVLLVLPEGLGRASGGDLGSLTWQRALAIGALQCLAMWPGVSRSLATILGGLAAGLSLASAVEFSFLLGLVTLTAATAYSALDGGEIMLEAYGFPAIACGFVTAWLSALLAVRWVVAWLTDRSLEIFGWWRLAAAASVAGLLVAGLIEI